VSEKPRSARDVLGLSKIFTPDVINDIHGSPSSAATHGCGFSMFKKMPH